MEVVPWVGEAVSRSGEAVTWVTEAISRAGAVKWAGVAASWVEDVVE